MYYINVPPKKKKEKKRWNLLIALKLLKGHCNLSDSLRFLLTVNILTINIKPPKKKKKKNV